MSFNWTPEALRAARRLYLELGLSASESAERLGTTRSALIAKAHRMGWAEERHPALAAANLARAHRAPPGSRLGPPPPPRRVPVPPPPSGTLPAAARPRSWKLRRAGECAFPVAGEGEAILSCCAPAGAGTYCAAHRAAIYRPLSPGRRRALERMAEWVDRLEQPEPRERRAGGRP